MNKIIVFVSGFLLSSLISIFIFYGIYLNSDDSISIEDKVFSENKIKLKSKEKSLWFKINSDNLYIASSHFEKFKEICMSVQKTPTEFIDQIQNDLPFEKLNDGSFRSRNFVFPEFIDPDTHSLILEDNHYFWCNYITKDKHGDVVHNVYYFPRKNNLSQGYILISKIKSR